MRRLQEFRGPVEREGSINALGEDAVDHEEPQDALQRAGIRMDPLGEFSDVLWSKREMIRDTELSRHIDGLRPNGSANQRTHPGIVGGLHLVEW